MVFPGITIALIAAAALALAAAYGALQHRREPATVLVVRLLVLAAAWAVLYAFEIAATSASAMVWWARFEYFAIVSIPVVWFLFALTYSGETRRVAPRSVGLLSIIPVATMVMVFTNGYHGLIWDEVNVVETAGLSLFDAVYGPWFVIHSVYSYGLMLIGSAVLLVGTFRSRGPFRNQTYLVVFAAAAPLVANAVSLTAANPWPGLDLTPFAFIAMGAALIWGMVGFRLLDASPVARHSIVEGMAEGVLVLDSDGLVTDTNPAALRILNLTAPALLGSPPPEGLRVWTDYGQPAQAKSVDETGGRAAVTLGPSGRMYDVLREQLSEPDGRPTGTLILLRDVTEYRRSLEATRRSEERFRELFDQSPVGTHEIDLRGVITRVNKTELDILGFDEHELIGRRTWEMVAEKDLDRRALEDAVRAGRVLDEVVERRYLRKDGSTFPGMGKSIALYDEEGRHIGFRTTIQDASALKNAEEEVQRLARRDRVVAEIGGVVSSSLDIDEVYERFANLIGEVIPWDRLVISLKDGPSGTETRAYVAGFDIPESRRGARHGLDQSIYAESGFPERGWLAVGEQMEAFAGRIPAVAAAFEAGIRSGLGVPLIFGDEAIGEVGFGSLKAQAYDESDLETVRRTAPQLSSAIANARLHAALGKEATEREVLADIGRIMSSTFDIDDVYDHFAEQVERLIPFDRISIAEVDPDRGTITNTYVTGVEVPGLEVGANTAIVDSSAAKTMMDGSDGILMTGREQDRIAETSHVEAANRAAGLRSKIAVPLVRDGDVIGVLNLRSSDPHGYTEEHMRMARRVGTQISGALSNVQRHRRLTEAQAALRESEERFRKMFQESPVGAAVIGLDSRFVRVNPAFSSLLGFGEDEMVGQTYLDFTHPDDLKLSEEVADKLIDDGAPLNAFEKRYIGKDGGTVWVSVTSTVVHDDAGRPLYVLGMVEDISERKKSDQIERMYRYRLEIHANEMSERYREAERLREELEQENRSRLRFLNVLSHELRTPLTPIISSGELLRERIGSDPDTLKLLANVLAGASTLRARIDDLLDVAAFQSGTYLLDKKMAEIGGLIQESCDLFEPEAARRSQSIETEIPEGLPRFEADGDRLKQVVINLVSNALKFGYPESTVTVRARSNETSVEFDVQDRGMGIAEEEQAKLFEPYFRTEQDRQRFPGLGLGLAVSKQIVEAHGGEIFVTSTRGVGSTFTVRLPLTGRLQEPSPMVRRANLRAGEPSRRK